MKEEQEIIRTLEGLCSSLNDSLLENNGLYDYFIGLTLEVKEDREEIVKFLIEGFFVSSIKDYIYALRFGLINYNIDKFAYFYNSILACVPFVNNRSIYLLYRELLEKLEELYPEY